MKVGESPLGCEAPLCQLWFPVASWPPLSLHPPWSSSHRPRRGDFLSHMRRTLLYNKATVWTVEAATGALERPARGLAWLASPWFPVATLQLGYFPRKEQGSSSGNGVFLFRLSWFLDFQGLPGPCHIKGIFLVHNNTKDTFYYHHYEYHPLWPKTGYFESLNFILFRQSSCMGKYLISWITSWKRHFPLGPQGHGLDPKVTPCKRYKRDKKANWWKIFTSESLLGSLLFLLADREKDTCLPSSSEEPLRWASEEPSQRPASPLRGLLVSEVRSQELPFLNCLLHPHLHYGLFCPEPHLLGLTHVVSCQPGLKMGYEGRDT